MCVCVVGGVVGVSGSSGSVGSVSGGSGPRLWGGAGAERMEVEGVRRDDDMLQPVCQHSPVAIH